MKKQRLIIVALLVVAGAALAVALERHRADLQRGILERAIQSQSVVPERTDGGDAGDVPAGVPAEFWESYYSDAGP